MYEGFLNYEAGSELPGTNVDGRCKIKLKNVVTVSGVLQVEDEWLEEGVTPEKYAKSSAYVLGWF